MTLSMTDKLKNIVTDLPISDSGDSTYVARFPSDLIFSNAGGESAKFCVFTIKKRRSGNSKILKGFIALPIPLELNDGLNVSYNTSSFGAVGAAAVGSLRGNISGEKFDEIRSNATRILKKGVGSFNSSNFFNIAAELALKGKPGLRAVFTNNENKIENPFMTSTFSGVGFREFSFNFNLVPKNKNDSIALNRVIQIFKSSMLPQDLVTSPESLNGMTFENNGVQLLPDVFGVRFYPTTKNFSSQKGNLMFKIEDAVMTKFDVTYSGDTPQPVFHEENNSPHSVNLTLNLKETVIYTRERCESDYNQILEEGA